MRVHGERERPRAGMLGAWTDEQVTAVQSFVPTVYDWRKDYQPTVHPDEVDLVLVHKPGNSILSSEHAARHVICFGYGALQVFRFVSPTTAFESRPCETQKSLLPDVLPPLAALRDRQISSVSDFRRWPTVATSVKQDLEAFDKGALLKAVVPAGGILSTICLRPSTGTGFAWLPWEPSTLWIQAIVSQWAESDRAAFARILPWREQPEWFTREERVLAARRQELVLARERALAEFDAQLNEVDCQFITRRTEGDNGLRALLSTQDEPLVHAVSRVLRGFGFVVDEMDATWPVGGKREDLRVRDPSVEGWEAVVEVKGFKRSGGSADDLRKLDRHARRYRDEKGAWPGARWFIVNGQYELPPGQRSRPFASAPDVIRDLGDHDDGLVIGTVDLFRAALAEPDAYESIRRKLVYGRGRFEV